MWSEEKKEIWIVELTVPWEGNMEWTHERKMAKYSELQERCREVGWKAELRPLEIDCRGFVGRSVTRFRREIGLTSKAVQKGTKRLQEVVERASAWIWSKEVNLEPISWIIVFINLAS